jgi:hypothetical protein
MAHAQSRHKRASGQLYGLLLVLGVALLFRLWQINTLPPGFHFDESFEGLEAWRILTTFNYKPLFLEGNFGVPPLNAYANALVFWVGGWFGIAPGPTLMRITAALFGVLGVLAVYGAAWELRLADPRRSLSPAFPLLAAGALAIMRWHVHFSRMGIEPVIVPLEWAGAIWLLLRGRRTRSWGNFVALAFVLAATLYTYQGAWVIPVIMGVTALLLLVDTSAAQTGLPRLWPRLLLAGALALVLVAPLLLYFGRHAELLLLRPAQIAVVGATGSPADQGILHNVRATITMFWPFDWPFGPTGDMDPRRNLPGAPALNLWLALPFWAGLLMALRRLRTPTFWIPLFGLIGLLSVGVVSEYAPHFHRVLGAAAPAALLCAMALDWLWQRRPQRAQWVGPVAAVALLMLGGLTSVRDYFVRWAALPDLYYAFDQGLWDVGRWVADQPPDAPVYLSPRPADHATLAFAWETRGRPAPVSFDARAIFPVTHGPTTEPESYAIINKEDFRGPLLLPEVLSQAAITRTLTDFAGETYATIHTRPAGPASARPPQVTVNARVGDGITLLGYDVHPATPRAGEMLYLQLHWLVGAVPMRDWTVFTHVIAPDSQDGAQVAGKDGPPGGGSLPTIRWQPGWRILDEYQILLPANLPAGTYTLATGLYTLDGMHLPAVPITLGAIAIEATP